jgi:hypothetical protein
MSKREAFGSPLRVCLRRLDLEQPHERRLVRLFERDDVDDDS